MERDYPRAQVPEVAIDTMQLYEEGLAVK